MRLAPFVMMIASALLLATEVADAQQPTLPWTPDGHPAAFTLSAGSGVAPATYHVNALPVPLTAGSPLTARYAWDFGDEGSKYDHLPGWVGAHVYDKAGTYTITLTVTDEANHRTEVKQTVTVKPDDRRAIYVAPAGSDDNNGATEAQPMKSPAAAFVHLAGGHAKVLFKAGGTYPINAPLSVRMSDVLLTSYGDGPKPIILLDHGPADLRGKPTAGAIWFDGRVTGITCEHIAFATPYVLTDPAAKGDKIGISAIYPRGREITIRDCSFRGLDDAINSFGNPVGLLVQGCDAPGALDLRGYFIWGQGSDHVYLGNAVGNSTREHNIRMSGLDRVLIYDNDLTNLDRTPVDPGDIAKGSIQMQLGSFGYIAHNRVTGGPLRTGPRGGDTEKVTTATDWCVIDGNDLTRTCLEVQGGTHHAMFRNNVVHLGEMRNRNVPIACSVAGPDSFGRTVTDLTFAHNTAIASGEAAIFLRTFGKQDGLTVADNLFVAPHLHIGQLGSSAMYVLGSDLTGFKAIAGNVWPIPEANEHDANGPFVIDPVGNKDYGRYVAQDAWLKMPPVSGDQFVAVTVDARGRPTSPCPASATSVPGVAFDHDGHPRAEADLPGAFAQGDSARGKLRGQ